MSVSKSPLRTPLARVRGLGTAHSGVAHWWLQRLSALALVPLTVWFMVALVSHLLISDRGAIALWFKNPFVAIAMLLLAVLMFVHARLGIQVIVEDYVHHEPKKVALLLFNTTAMLLMGVTCVFAIVQLHFIGI